MRFFSLCIIAAARTALVSAVAPRKRMLMMVGGDLDDYNREIFELIISNAGGSNSTLCVIATNGEDPCCDPDSSWVFYQQLFTGYGATDVKYINIDVNNSFPATHTGNAYDPAIIEQIKSCDGFWFGGGDQTRIMKAWYDNNVTGKLNTRTPTPAMTALLERFEEHGGVLAGSSAGTDCHNAKVMVTDGDSYSGLVKDTVAYNYSEGAVDLDDGTVTFDPNGALGTFSYGLLDTHFGERGRQGRMIRLLMDTLHLPNGYPIGFGVDQNTVIIVDKDDPSHAIVRGQAGVTICNVEDASTTQWAGAWSVTNVRCNYATPGDTVHMTTGTISFGADKTALKGRETAEQPYTSRDVFNSPKNPSTTGSTHEFVLQATSLFNSTATTSTGLTFETEPKTFAVRMTKDDRSVAYQGMHNFNGTLQSYTSYMDLVVDIFALDTKEALSMAFMGGVTAERAQIKGTIAAARAPREDK